MNTVRLIPLFNEDQWRVVCALEQAGKAGKIVPMPGTRLQHWFPDMCDGLRGVGNGADPGQRMLAHGLAHHFFRQTLPLALVKVDGRTKHLALVIADEDTAIGVPGGRLVQVVSWSRALEYLDRGQGSSLIDMADNIVACGRAQASITIHEEEAALKTEIARYLHLAWPEALDRSTLDADTIALVTSFLDEQRGRFAIFRDVAVSRLIDLVPGEVVDRDMRKVFDTSDVDVVIHGRPPYNILHKFEFPFQYRPEKRYALPTVPMLEVLQSLKPGAYYSHATALAVHALVDTDRQPIYINHEQRPHQRSELADQPRIDAAFKSKPRLSSNVIDLDGTGICMLNGMHTEPPRVLWRLHSLRKWSYEEATQVFPRSHRARCAHGQRGC